MLSLIWQLYRKQIEWRSTITSSMSWDPWQSFNKNLLLIYPQQHESSPIKQQLLSSFFHHAFRYLKCDEQTKQLAEAYWVPRDCKGLNSIPLMLEGWNQPIFKHFFLKLLFMTLCWCPRMFKTIIVLKEAPWDATQWSLAYPEMS